MNRLQIFLEDKFKVAFHLKVVLQFKVKTKIGSIFGGGGGQNRIYPKNLCKNIQKWNRKQCFSLFLTTLKAIFLLQLLPPSHFLLPISEASSDNFVWVGGGGGDGYKIKKYKLKMLGRVGGGGG